MYMKAGIDESTATSAPIFTASKHSPNTRAFGTIANVDKMWREFEECT